MKSQNIQVFWKSCVACFLVFVSSEDVIGQGILADANDLRRTEAEAQDCFLSFLELQDKADDRMAFLVKGQTLSLSSNGTVESTDTRMLSVYDKVQNKLRIDLVSNGEFSSESNLSYNQMLVLDGQTYRGSGLISEYYFPEDILKPGFRAKPMLRFSPFSVVVASAGDIIVGNYEPPMSGLLFSNANFIEATKNEKGINAMWTFGTPAQGSVTIQFSSAENWLPTRVLWRVVKDLDATEDVERFRMTVSLSQISWAKTLDGWRPIRYIINGRSSDKKLEIQKELAYRWIPTKELQTFFTRESIASIGDEEGFEALWQECELRLDKAD